MAWRQRAAFWKLRLRCRSFYLRNMRAPNWKNMRGWLAFVRSYLRRIPSPWLESLKRFSDRPIALRPTESARKANTLINAPALSWVFALQQASISSLRYCSELLIAQNPHFLGTRSHWQKCLPKSAYGLPQKEHMFLGAMSNNWSETIARNPSTPMC